MRFMKFDFFRRKKILLMASFLAVAVVSMNMGLHKSIDRKMFPDEANYCFYAGLFKSFVHQHHDNIFWGSQFKYKVVPAGVYWIALTIYFSEYNYMLQEPAVLFAAVANLPDKSSPLNNFVLRHPFPYIKDMVHLLRHRMLVFRALTCIVIFMLVWYIGGYLGAGLAVLFLLLNNSFIFYSSLVTLDVIWLFQHFLNILLIYYYCRSVGADKFSLAYSSLMAGLVAVSLGVFAATKIHGALNFIVLLVSLIPVYRYEILADSLSALQKATIAGQLLMIIVLSLTVFVLLNPALYNNTLEGLLNLLPIRLSATEGYLQRTFYQQDFLPTFWQRLMYLKQCVSLADILAMLAGFIFLCRNIMKSKKATVAFVLVSSFLVYFFAILSFMRWGQKRYVFILLCYIAIFESIGFFALIRLFYHFLKEKLCPGRN